MNDEQKTALLEHLDTITACSNRMVGAAMVNDMPVITSAGVEIDEAVRAITDLIEEG